MQVTLFPDMIKFNKQGKDRQKNQDLNLKYCASEAEKVPFPLSQCPDQQDYAMKKYVHGDRDTKKESKKEKAAL